MPGCRCVNCVPIGGSAAVAGWRRRSVARVVGGRSGGLARIAAALAAGALLVAGGLCLALVGAVVGLGGVPGVGGAAAVGGAPAVGGALGGQQLVCGVPVTVGATEYGGPGDPSSGTVGASGVNLLAHPDSFAELGGTTFAAADSLGDLPYGTALAISAGGATIVARKEDIGLGGGPVAGLPRAIDLWWRLAAALGIPYEHGRWAGAVQIALPAADCAGAAPLTSGPRALLLADGLAAAPAGAPAAVRGIIASGNQIVGKPYVYGGGHGVPLDVVAASYDCSSSVAHLLYGGGLLPAGADLTSGDFERWGEPGPGRWVTIYASATHVFMYVAGLRWDTWNAAGPGDGADGIGWHPLVRSAAGFVVRHPPGL